MKAIYKKRLLKLAAFLDKLPRKKFDFAICRAKRACGTVACAVGWTPAVFPRTVGAFTFGGEEYVAPHNHNGFPWTASECAAHLFGIDISNAYLLFYPDARTPPPWLKKPLDSEATPKQVAASIRRFIRWKEKQA